MSDQGASPILLPDGAPLPADAGPTVVTVGTFDGVHLGHQHVIARLVARARATGLRSVLVTFEPHPLELVRPEAAPRLLTLPDEKLEALARSGLDYVSVLPFTEELRALAADQYVDTVLRARFRMRELLIGYDHGFGRDRKGNVATLQELGTTRGFLVEVVEPVPAPDGGRLSSSRIREDVAAARLDEASAALGRPYSLRDTVVHGEARGRALGFRTLNLALPSPRKLLPPEGVYAVRAATPSGLFGGMMHMGPRPTFDDALRTLEVHLFDAEEDWYGASVRVEFVRRLRGVQRFENAAALVAQLRTDEREAREVLGRPEPAAAAADDPERGP